MQKFFPEKGEEMGLGLGWGRSIDRKTFFRSSFFPWFFQKDRLSSFFRISFFQKLGSGQYRGQVRLCVKLCQVFQVRLGQFVQVWIGQVRVVCLGLGRLGQVGWQIRKNDPLILKERYFKERPQNFERTLLDQSNSSRLGWVGLGWVGLGLSLSFRRLIWFVAVLCCVGVCPKEIFRD